MKDFSLPKEHRLLNKKDFATLRSKKALKLYFKTFKVIYTENNQGITLALVLLYLKKLAKQTLEILLREELESGLDNQLKKDSGVFIIVIHPKYKLFGKDKFLKELLSRA